MILLDTDVLSEMMRRRPDPTVARWFERKEPNHLAISVITIFELRFGTALLPASPERQRLSTMIERFQTGVFGAILPLDEASAVEASAFRAHRRSIGRPVSVPDSLIAGAALSGRARLATRNLRDFEAANLVLIDPFESQSP